MVVAPLPAKMVSSSRPVTTRRVPDGTATSAVDYYSRSGSLTFNPGVTTRTITVWLRASSARGKYFYVDLSNPTNATIAVGRATGTIR
jgi:endoglucanase